MFFLLSLQGCFTTKEGLKIAYLSGVQSDDILSAKSHNYTAANLQNLEVRVTCAYVTNIYVIQSLGQS